MSNLKSYMTDGWQQRLQERTAHYAETEGVGDQHAFSMALFEESLRAIAHIERAQQDLLADLERRVTNLEIRVRRLEAEGEMAS